MSKDEMPIVPDATARAMWYPVLTKYVAYLEANQVRIKARPLGWKRIGSRLEIATALGIIYSVCDNPQSETGRFTAVGAGETLYEGEDKAAAMQAAHDNFELRIRAELLVQ